MKFFSKYNNFRILLTPNIPGNPYMQIPPVYGKSVKFTYGVAEVEDEEIIKLLKAHDQFGKDFFAEEVDPFKATRVSSEPVHDVTEIEAGRPGKSVSSQGSPINTDKIADMVKKMAMQLLEEGGYQKVDADGRATDETPAPVSVESDDEPMDTALSDAGEIEEKPPVNTIVPPAIKAEVEEPEDDINPLASTLPEEVKDDSSEKESSVKTKSKAKKTTKK